MMILEIEMIALLLRVVVCCWWSNNLIFVFDQFLLPHLLVSVVLLIAAHLLIFYSIEEAMVQDTSNLRATGLSFIHHFVVILFIYLW